MTPLTACAKSKLKHIFDTGHSYLKGRYSQPMKSLSRFQLAGIATSAAIGITLLNSCNTMIVGRSYKGPETIMPDTWHQSLSSDLRSDSSSLQNWWTKFNDPTLNKLIALSSQATQMLRLHLRASSRRKRVEQFPAVA